MQTISASLLILAASIFHPHSVTGTNFDTFKAHVPIQIVVDSKKQSALLPQGIAPSLLKRVYNLPSSGGSGTIAIIDAYADPHLESDLAMFDKTYNISSCTKANKCLTITPMADNLSTDQSWALETSLDVEWAHALAPNAKIELIQAASSDALDLLIGVDYARQQSAVRAITMSWGGNEFPEETLLDGIFTSATSHPISFFASSGDTGAGVSWPAVSPNITSVGGTSLLFHNNNLLSETAWNGSGGGISSYESEPWYQSYLNIPNADGMRGVPDVSFDADPASGVAVYDSNGFAGQAGWFQVGGTSLGAPAWAAIQALGNHVTNSSLYSRDKVEKSYFRDIVVGTNGLCGYYCSAHVGYDYVTGIGSPLSDTF